MPTSLQLPFHRQVIAELKRREPEAWKWFVERADDPLEQSQIVTDLLKQTVRLEASNEPRLEAALNQARESLAVELPVTLYRSTSDAHANAAIASLSGQFHLVLSGAIDDLLDEHELAALMAHELAHALLWEEDSGEVLVADQMLHAWANQTGIAHTSWQETARRFRLFTEIACDRACMQVIADPLPIIGVLVKTATRSSRVDAAAYLKQASEIIEREGGLHQASASEGSTHPEEYIRALALAWWQETKSAAEPTIERLVAGPITLTRIDLLEQTRLAKWTQTAIRQLLQPAWRRSLATLAHAKLFFDGELEIDEQEFEEPEVDEPLAERDLTLAVTPTESPIEEAPIEDDLDLASASSEVQDYACFLLLDFLTCDPQLADPAAAQALLQADAWGVGERLNELLRKELKWGKRQIDKQRREAPDLLQKLDSSSCLKRSRHSNQVEAEAAVSSIPAAPNLSDPLADSPTDQQPPATNQEEL